MIKINKKCRYNLYVNLLLCQFIILFFQKFVQNYNIFSICANKKCIFAKKNTVSHKKSGIAAAFSYFHKSIIRDVRDARDGDHDAPDGDHGHREAHEPDARALHNLRVSLSMHGH